MEKDRSENISVQNLLLTAILCSLFSIHSYGSFDFLNLDTNARPSALGGAFAGISDDVNSIRYNPAGLGKVNNNEISLMYNRHFQEVNQGYVAFVHKNGFGLSVNYLDYGDIQRTTIDDRRGTNLDKYSIKDAVIYVGFGKEIYKKLYSGISFKYISEQIDKVQAQVVGIDIGLLYQTFIDKLWAGVNLQNVGTKALYKTLQEELPLNLKVGVGYKPSGKLLFAIDFNQEKNKELKLNLGIEYSPIKLIVLRAGFDGKNDAGFGLTAGIGINLKKLALDYAFIPYGDLGNTHRISFSAKF
ncbi:MAG: PorV/PorQ family protein [Elusimicrobiota bacterium]|nr:PorV/PorQ family protein [Elusimicrobiota bacterium]